MYHLGTNENFICCNRNVYISMLLYVFQELEVMNLNGMGPNFHKLQVFSNSFEDLIDETPTFGFILKCIKVKL